MIKPAFHQLHNLVITTIVSLLTFLILLPPSVMLGQSGANSNVPQAKPAATSGSAGPELLLTKAPFDRIFLKDSSEIDVEPVTPRPLPPAKKVARRPASRKRSAEAEAKAKEAEKDPAIRLFVQPVEAEGAEYALYREDMTDILYFEDMLLREAETLITAKDYAKAFEYILLVNSRDPKWRGLDSTHRRLLLEEAKLGFAAGQHAAGLQYISEVQSKNPQDAEAKALAIQGLAQLADSDLLARRFERARESHQRIMKLDPSAPTARILAEKLHNASRTLMESAPKQKPERLDILNEAYRAWPETPGLAEARNEALKLWPTVRVAVQESTNQPPNIWGKSDSNVRIMSLCFQPLLQDLQENSFKGQNPGQLLERFEMSDLTTASLTLKQGLKWSNGRPVNSRDVVAALSSWAQPSSPAYNAVWASQVETISATDDRKIQVKFIRPLLQPENWFLRAIGPAETSQAAKLDSQFWSGSGDYSWTGNKVDSETVESVFERRPDKIDGLFRIREIVFDDELAGWQALIDNRVDVVERVPAELDIEKARSEQIQTTDYAYPEIHVLAIDGRNTLNLNRSFRRALGYALNRAELLEEQFLRRPPKTEEFLADGPFAKGSNWDDTNYKPQAFDASMATLLFASARRELKLQRLSITIDYPKRSDINRTVTKIAEDLKSYGLEVTLKPWQPGELEERLASGQTFQLAWRVLNREPNHFQIGGAISPSIYAQPSTNGLAAMASPVTLAQVLDVERAWNEADVRLAIRNIDRMCREELPLIPLWQVPRRMAFRKQLAGLKPSSGSLYENVGSWSLQPNPAK